jgi:hypothetical protein
MNQAAILMDPMDPRIQLDVLQNTERRTLDTVKGLNSSTRKEDRPGKRVSMAHKPRTYSPTWKAHLEGKGPETPQLGSRRSIHADQRLEKS